MNSRNELMIKKEALFDLMPIHNQTAFVCDNIALLKREGLYETALLRAYTGTKLNFSRWSRRVVEYLFVIADRQNLIDAGDPIPNEKTFVLYRGVAGVGRKRRVNGISWTSSMDTAVWFAGRNSRLFFLPDPAVFTVTVSIESVLAYYNGRDEAEFLLQLPLPVKPKRVVKL
jgi:hypothetical protein